MTEQPDVIDPMKNLLDTVEVALEYFFHKDHMNAIIHVGAVRYSPITFRLAELLSRHGTYQADNWKVSAVMHDSGRYQLDKGREQ